MPGMRMEPAEYFLIREIFFDLIVYEFPCLMSESKSGKSRAGMLSNNKVLNKDEIVAGSIRINIPG